MANQQDSYYLALKKATKAANSALSLRRICNSIAKTAAKTIGANGCRILVLDSQKKYLTTIGAHGLSELYLRKAPLDACRSLPEILNGKVVFVADAITDGRIQHREIAKTQGIASILGIPIVERGETIGEIRVYTHEPHQFSKDDEAFLQTIADISTVILQRAELHQLLEKGYKLSDEQAKLARASHFPASLPISVNFAHSSEEEFAKLLNFYRIEWLYEPRSFPLRWENGKIAEMFTPDFYLPELNLYIELTTLKQNLITEKNRKLRRLKELYPEINIKLLTKDDFVKLLAKYGYGPLAQAKVERIERVLYSHRQIQRRVITLARHISHDYDGQHLVIVGILKGVVYFMTDLTQHLSLPVTIDFMAISYYGSEEDRVIKIIKDLDSNITGQHVLLVEDIVDTGMTLNYILNHLSALKPASLRVCTLLDKRARRLVDVPLNYIGFEIPDEFVIGYGLDYNGEYRNLPFIGVLNPGEYKEK
jgi:hypoxanthine phosphoribosyltransferase